MGRILVIGASGRIGRRVVHALRELDDLRALARSDVAAARIAELGVREIVRGDLDAPSSLEAAFADVSRCLLVTPFSDDQPRREQAAIDAARRAGVERVVKISSEAIRLSAAAGGEPIVVARSHLAGEQALQAAGIESVLLRPTFIAHVLAGQVEQIRNGVLDLPFGEAEMAFVHPADVADAAVAALLAERPEPGPIHLTGPAAQTLTEVAELISDAVGRPIAYRPLTNDAWCSRAIDAGLPPDFAAGLAAGFRIYEERGRADVEDGVERIVGRPARPLGDYVRDELTAAIGPGTAL